MFDKHMYSDEEDTAHRSLDALSVTCRQIHRECASFYYSGNTFVLKNFEPKAYDTVTWPEEYELPELKSLDGALIALHQSIGDVNYHALRSVIVDSGFIVGSDIADDSVEEEMRVTASLVSEGQGAKALHPSCAIRARIGMDSLHFDEETLTEMGYWFVEGDARDRQELVSTILRKAHDMDYGSTWLRNSWDSEDRKGGDAEGE